MITKEVNVYRRAVDKMAEPLGENRKLQIRQKSTTTATK